MVSEELKERIIPKLKPCIRKESWRWIDWMFEEAYETTHDGFKMITIRPPPNSNLVVGFMFYECTGCFYDTPLFYKIKAKGKRI